MPSSIKRLLEPSFNNKIIKKKKSSTSRTKKKTNVKRKITVEGRRKKGAKERNQYKIRRRKRALTKKRKKSNSTKPYMPLIPESNNADLIRRQLMSESPKSTDSKTGVTPLLQASNISIKNHGSNIKSKAEHDNMSNINTQYVLQKNKKPISQEPFVPLSANSTNPIEIKLQKNKYIPLEVVEIPSPNMTSNSNTQYVLQKNKKPIPQEPFVPLSPDTTNPIELKLSKKVNTNIQFGNLRNYRIINSKQPEKKSEKKKRKKKKKKSNQALKIN